MSTRLSFEASKKIFELIGDYNTETRWVNVDGDFLNDGSGEKEWSLLRDFLPSSNSLSFPTPSFSELVRVLPKIGEKKDWWPHNDTDVLAGHLARIYANAPTEPEGMAAVERYLMEILK